MKIELESEAHQAQGQAQVDNDKVLCDSGIDVPFVSRVQEEYGQVYGQIQSHGQGQDRGETESVSRQSIDSMSFVSLPSNRSRDTDELENDAINKRDRLIGDMWNVSYIDKVRGLKTMLNSVDAARRPLADVLRNRKRIFKAKKHAYQFNHLLARYLELPTVFDAALKTVVFVHSYAHS